MSAPRVTEGVFDPVEELVASCPLDVALRFAEVKAALRPLDEAAPEPEAFRPTVAAVFTP